MSCLIFFDNKTPDAMRIPIRARNGASNAIRIKNRDMISSTIEKTGFAAPREIAERKPLPVTVAVCMPIEVPPPAMIANAH